jgi:GDP-L-fucose synthase
MIPGHKHRWEQLDQGDAFCASCGESAAWARNAEDFPYKRVLVTGGGGFLGRVVVANLRLAPYLQIFAPHSDEYDLRNADEIERCLLNTSPDLVIHLAAVVGGIGHNQKHPGQFFYDNLIMGVQLLEQSRLLGVQKFVAIGTVCAYPKLTPVPFREIDLWDGYPEETNAPYGLAKKMMLVQSQAYREQYGFNSIFLLPANLYGPGDNFDLETSHVIPALIRKCVDGRRNNAPAIEVWGTGSASREFLYVDDCAEGILQAAMYYNDSAPVNLGNGREVTIKELAEKICYLTGFTGEVKWGVRNLEGQQRRCLDVRRARERFGFQATTTLEEGLAQTIRWYAETYK